MAKANVMAKVKVKATRVSKRGAASRPLVAPRTPGAWKRGWQRTWKKLGFVPYELPADDSAAGQERGLPDAAAHS